MARRRERRFYIREAWVHAESKSLFGFLNRYRGEYRLVNLSRRGVCFYASERPKEAMILSLLIDVPAEVEPFELKGQVTWVRQIKGLQAKFAVGVEFESGVDVATEGRLVQLLANPEHRMASRQVGWRRRA